MGASLGIAVGGCAAWAITAAGIAMPPLPNANIGYTMSIRLTPGAAATAFAVGFAATVLASLWPAARVSGKSIVESLRQNV
jgi:putative ABC transport system permease protein